MLFCGHKLHKMNSQENYIDSASYEAFLSRAFQFDKRIEKASNQEYLNLIDAEMGMGMRFLPTFEKQLMQIKTRLSTAIEILLKQKISNVNKTRLIELLDSIEKIKSYKDVIIIVEAGLDYTDILRDS